MLSRNCWSVFHFKPWLMILKDLMFTFHSTCAISQRTPILKFSFWASTFRICYICCRDAISQFSFESYFVWIQCCGRVQLSVTKQAILNKQGRSCYCVMQSQKRLAAPEAPNEMSESRGMSLSTKGHQQLSGNTSHLHVPCQAVNSIDKHTFDFVFNFKYAVPGSLSRKTNDTLLVSFFFPCLIYHLKIAGDT